MFQRDLLFSRVAINGKVLWEKLRELLIETRQVAFIQSNPDERRDNAFRDGLDIDAIPSMASLVVVLIEEGAVANNQQTQERRKSVLDVTVDLCQDSRIHRFWWSGFPASGWPIIVLQRMTPLYSYSGYGMLHWEQSS